MPPKTVVLIGAACVTTGWLLASMLTPPIANLQDLPQRRPTVPEQRVEGVVNTAPFTERLHTLLRQAPPPPVSRRNPFAFASRQRVDMVAATPAEPARSLEPQAAPVIAGPRFTLSGIAATEGPNGPTHTAVLSDGTTVHLVKAGDSIAGYRVVEVTESSVTLADADGARQTLRLAP